AADPNRAADGAHARLTGALLAPRLDAAAAHFGLRLLSLRARTAGCAIRSHNLVHERLVEFTRKRRIGHLEVLRLRTLADQLQIHGGLLLLYPGLLLGRSRGFLLRSSSRRFDGRANDHLTARRAGDGTANQQQVALGIDANDLQVLDRATTHAHVARHALTGEDATWRLTLTDGAGNAVRHRRTVGGVAAREVVALHDARETLTGRGTRDVDDLAFLEQVDLELTA